MLQTVHIHTDQVDPTLPVAAAFFAEVLGLDLERVVMTDLSELSDFRFSGNWKAPLGATYAELCAHWDQWVLEQIRSVYHLELSSTSIALLALWNQIEQPGRMALH